ncbi:hypothetical protein EKO27_g484 [Xylaria grammica]|uniref:Uncharacterized protein n=1 Tax=Xylaria grammica TaxID=363999 RepID=A0A439DJM3_9PEZI|nr:hypothetical protein EKO27_g484 [Xylaria grammica]
MSYNSQILMSGSFHFDPSNGGGGTSFSGVHPGIFRPPASPSVSSSMYLAKSTASLQSEAQTPILNVKRKRIGLRESTPVGDWAMTVDGNFNTDVVMGDGSDFNPSTNGKERRYVLAGQIETPNGAPQGGFGHIEDSVYSDIDYRRALGSKRSRDEVDLPASRPMKIDSGDQISGGWSSYAISTIGGVVGRVWEFCKTGAFRGFYAGGGAGYGISESTRVQPTYSQAGHDGYDMTPVIRERDPSPLYGSLPESDYSPYYYERETPESTPPPAPKRRQISYGTPTDELRKNWVMIDEPANESRQSSLASRASSRRPVQQTTAPSLVRRISKPVSRLNAPNFNRHPPTRPSTAIARPAASASPISNREPASFASTRSPVPSPVIKPHAPSKIPVASRPHSPSPFAASHFTQQPSRIPSPSPYAKRGHSRSQSTMSASSISPMKMKKRESLHEMRDNTPRLDAKARNLAAKRMKDEMETDLRINDFNSRLRDMIRQGKEALGTTYEVELDDDGGRGGDLWESD